MSGEKSYCELLMFCNYVIRRIFPPNLSCQFPFSQVLKLSIQLCWEDNIKCCVSLLCLT